jgi:hypothetical protein
MRVALPCRYWGSDRLLYTVCLWSSLLWSSLSDPQYGAAVTVCLLHRQTDCSTDRLCLFAQ